MTKLLKMLHILHKQNFHLYVHSGEV